jgi:hypothetical protein
MSGVKGVAQVIGFFRAHGYDPGPTQRPLLAGAITGALATIPTGAVVVAFGSFKVAAVDVLRLPLAWTGAMFFASFTLGGLLYGAFFQRAANDRRAGWLFGLAYGFVLWIAAPIVVLPLFRGPAMAGGLAATGIFVGFLVWGVAAGLLFPFVHKPLQAGVEVRAGRFKRFGPDAAALTRRLLRRPV